jgi:hypothetical protein
MFVELKRTGGFAGLATRKAIDSNALQQEDAKTLQKLIDGAQFFQLPVAIPASGPGADRFHYKLTVDSEGRSHTVDVDEAAASPALKSLIQWIISAPSNL